MSTTVSATPKPTPLEQLGSSPMPMQGAPQVAVSPHRWTSLTTNHRKVQAYDPKFPWPAPSMLKSDSGAPTLGPVGGMTGATANPVGQFKPLSFNGGPGLSPPVVRRATEAPPVHRAGSQFGPRPPAAASLQNTPRLLRGDCNPMFFPPRSRQIPVSPQQPGLSVPPSPQAGVRTYRWPPFFGMSEGRNDPLGASRVTTSIGPSSIGVAREATAPSSRQFFAPMTPLTAQPVMGLGVSGREVQGRVVRRIRIGVDGTVKSIEDLTDDGQPRQAGSIEAPAVNRAATASLP
ncbi:hypothetical protein FOZ62_011444, partial [Perkinsus olseni]